MEALLVYPEKKKDLQAIKAVLKALNVRFEATDSQYDPTFVKMVEKGSQDIVDGKGVKMDIKNLWK
jgi:hypothetical protein